ncbi:MAG: type II toxin-antitoxin system RelE/ParE family toxin [Bacteroidales bacterium]|nr:type II toxin-antitoxin system RelE/ParE family toxin [Bacteroidales bacterium]
MAFFRIEWKQSAIKELRKLTKPDIPKIIKAVESLSVNPYPAGCRKLRATEYTYRLRVGQYRVIYSIHADVLIIEIIRVGHRKSVYRDKS